jgi:hypothetical protein
MSSHLPNMPSFRDQAHQPGLGATDIVVEVDNRQGLPGLDRYHLVVNGSNAHQPGLGAADVASRCPCERNLLHGQVLLLLSIAEEAIASSSRKSPCSI